MLKRIWTGEFNLMFHTTVLVVLGFYAAIALVMFASVAGRVLCHTANGYRWLDSVAHGQEHYPRKCTR
jgi:UPF0716 family protein affecting phage T7 exclusion